MLDAKTYQVLVQNAPEAVMVRTVLEHALEPKMIDRVFESSREDQYTRDLLFSSVVTLMASVVCRVSRSVNSGFQLYRDKFTVSLKSIYNKINATDPSVCEGLFAHTAERMGQVLEELAHDPQPLVPGYHTRIVDGNQFAATEHRLKELRTTASGPLPGKALVVWDADRKLITHVYCCEDSYTQERKMLLDVIEDIEADQLWIADRNFCTAAFLWQLKAMQGFFIIRRHAKNVRLRETGPQRNLGTVPTGTIKETPIVIEDDFGGQFPARLIRLELASKTRDGEMSIELLTNLPATVDAAMISRSYQQRWQIETVFFELDRVFNGEIKSLGHPGAALLAFSLSLVAYNALRVVRAALASVHGHAAANQVSDYYLTESVFSDWRALDIFASPADWRKRYGHASPTTIADDLRKIAKRVDLTRLKKNTRGPKKPRPKRTSAKHKPHVSTKRILDLRKQIK